MGEWLVGGAQRPKVNKYCWKNGTDSLVWCTLLNSQQVKEDATKKVKKDFEMDENQSKTCQSLLNTMKVVLRGKFVSVNAYIKKEGRSKINNLIFHLKETREIRKQRAN